MGPLPAACMVVTCFRTNSSARGVVRRAPARCLVVALPPPQHSFAVGADHGDLPYLSAISNSAFGRLRSRQFGLIRPHWYRAALFPLCPPWTTVGGSGLIRLHLDSNEVKMCRPRSFKGHDRPLAQNTYWEHDHDTVHRFCRGPVYHGQPDPGGLSHAPGSRGIDPSCGKQRSHTSPAHTVQATHSVVASPAYH